MHSDVVSALDEQSAPLLLNAVTNSLQTSSPDSVVEYRPSIRRWYMLVVVVVLNLSNGMIWMTFSSIADSATSYYDVSPMAVNWLSIVFMIVTVVLGPLAMWLLDSRGLRVCLITAAWLNGIGAACRIISCSPAVHRHRYVVLLIGQIIAGCAQPFVMFTPTKLAAQWFSENQRTFANMLGSTANPVGILLGGVMSTVLVPNGDSQSSMPLLLEIFAVPAFIGVAMATFGVCSSFPPSPPSFSAAESCEPFSSGIRKLMCIRSFWLLAVCFGAGIGLISSFVTILDQLLCIHGYSDFFVGMCSVLLFGVGLVGATVISIVVDKTHEFELTAKICFSMAGCMLIAFMVVARFPNMEVLLAVLCALLGFFGVALNPVCLELSVECIYPVAEGTSSGILILSGQIQAAVFTFLMTIGSNVNSPKAEMCLHGDIIKLSSTIGFIAVTGILTVFFITFFHCTYRRLQVEELVQAQRTTQEI